MRATNRDKYKRYIQDGTAPTKQYIHSLHMNLSKQVKAKQVTTILQNTLIDN